MRGRAPSSASRSGTTPPRLLKRGTFTSEQIPLLSCNLGRDVTLATAPMPDILADVLGDREWADFASRTNARLKHYRPKK